MLFQSTRALGLPDASCSAYMATVPATSTSHSLGMSFSTKLRAVLLPQIMPAVIPPTGNQLISMLKGTSLVSVLGVADLLQSVQLIYATTY